MYMGMEVWHHKTSHRSMGLIGGLCFLVGGVLDDLFPKWSVRKTSIVLAVIITVLELTAGLIWNKKHKIWDYREMPLNYKGQVCVTFFLIWLIIFGPLIQWIDNNLESEDRTLVWYYKQMVMKGA